MLFFKSEDELQDFSKKIFNVLDIDNFSIIESVNVYKGFYGSYKVLGVKLKLEYNSYDYEDEYNYMMTIDNDFTSTLNINDNSINYFTEMIMYILSNSLSIKKAVEVEDKLKPF